MLGRTKELAQGRWAIMERGSGMVDRGAALVLIRADAYESSQALRREGMGNRLENDEHMAGKE